VSWRRTPGPITSTTVDLHFFKSIYFCTGYVSWGALIRRAYPQKQQETLTAISRTNSRNMHTTVLNRKEKLSGERPNQMVTPIYVKPVNFVDTWTRWGTTDAAEDRGPVVLSTQSRVTRKGAKSSHINMMGDAYLGSNQSQKRSPNGECSRCERTNELTPARGRALMAIERIKQAGSNHPWNNLMRLLEDEDLWVAAYTKLTPNPGLRYEAGVGGTIDGTSLKTLKALQRAVLERRFEWGTTQRVLGLRKEGQRPLEIPELQDRIVQEVLRRILDAIYEPQFVNQSHGFRPKRSQHSCIKYIRAWFPGTVWYIEGAQQCFDTIDHDSLMAILQKSIADKRFLTLISKGLKSRALSPKGNEKNG
jgi:hypothetical protein